VNAVRRLRLALAAVPAASAVVLSVWGPDAQPATTPARADASSHRLAPPFAAGDEAANIALRARDQRVVIRWVARRTGRLEALHIRVKVRGRGYGGGSTGVLHATTHPVRPDGKPRTAVVLSRARLSPGRRQWGGSVALPMHLPVRAGQELATVIRNAAADPRRDYFSTNFLHAEQGLVGANGRNERRRSAGDAYYGLDPRELVGYSADGGASWRLPGAPYGPQGGRAFIPTYVQQYADGRFEGQCYYWSSPASGRVTMVYPEVASTWRITHLGTFTRGGAAEVVLTVDGERHASARLAGTGFVVEAIAPVTVSKGSTVTVTTIAGNRGLALSRQFADAVWARLMGLGRHFHWYLRGEPQTAVPLYPLPAPIEPS
jgi:hypothetical protein